MKLFQYSTTLCLLLPCLAAPPPPGDDFEYQLLQASPPPPAQSVSAASTSIPARRPSLIDRASHIRKIPAISTANYEYMFSKDGSLLPSIGEIGGQYSSNYEAHRIEATSWSSTEALVMCSNTYWPALPQFINLAYIPASKSADGIHHYVCRGADEFKTNLPRRFSATVQSQFYRRRDVSGIRALEVELNPPQSIEHSRPGQTFSYALQAAAPGTTGNSLIRTFPRSGKLAKTLNKCILLAEPLSAIIQNRTYSIVVREDRYDCNSWVQSEAEELVADPLGNIQHLVYRFNGSAPCSDSGCTMM